MRSPLLLLLVAVTRAQDYEKVQIGTEPVADGVWMLTGAGGNIGVSAGPDGVFLIDDQYAPLTEKIRAAVAKISDRPIRFVLNTHFHGDHTGGNENLGKTGVLIVAHDNVRTRLNTEQFNAFFNRKTPPAPAAALPVVTFSEAVTFHLNGDEIHCFHVPPAHTDGDAVVTFRKADAVHMGDLFFNGLYPFIDTGAGGSLDGMIAASDLVLARTDAKTRIIPGHGPLGDRAALQSYRDMLAGVRGRIRPLVEAGKTLEEIRAARPTAEWDEKWGKGFMKPDSFVGIVVDGMRQRAPR